MINMNKLIKYYLYNTVIYNLRERSLSRHHLQYREKGRWGNFKNGNFWSLVAKLAYCKIWTSKIGVSTVFVCQPFVEQAALYLHVLLHKTFLKHLHCLVIHDLVQEHLANPWPCPMDSAMATSCRLTSHSCTTSPSESNFSRCGVNWLWVYTFLSRPCFVPKLICAIVQCLKNNCLHIRKLCVSLVN